MVREVRRQTDDAQIPHTPTNPPTNHLGIPYAGDFNWSGRRRQRASSHRWRLCDCNGRQYAGDRNEFILMSKIWVGSPKPSAMRHLLRQPTHHLVRREQSPRTRLPTSPERTSRSLLPVNPVPQQVAGPSCQRPKQKSWRSTLLAGRLQVGRSKWTSQFNRDPNEARA